MAAAPILADGRPEPVPGWDSATLANLAVEGCKNCLGLGRPVSQNPKLPCRCVTRRVFKRYLGRYHRLGWIHGRTFPRCTGNGWVTWEMPGADWRADFEMVVRHAISPAGQWRTSSKIANAVARDEIFTLYHLQEQPWRTCLAILAQRGIGIDRGNFFHEVYRVEEIGGQALHLAGINRNGGPYLRPHAFAQPHPRLLEKARLRAMAMGWTVAYGGARCT